MITGIAVRPPPITTPREHRAQQPVCLVCEDQIRIAASPPSNRYWVLPGQPCVCNSAENVADSAARAARLSTPFCAVAAVWLLDDVGAALYECSPIGKTVLHELRLREAYER